MTEATAGQQPTEIPTQSDALAQWLDACAQAEQTPHATYLPYLAHPVQEVQCAAIRGLWHGPPAVVGPLLLQLANSSHHMDVRATAISTMARLLFLATLSAEDREMNQEPPVTSDIARSIEQLCLHLALDEGQPLTVRRSAVESLAFRPPRPVRTLIEAWAGSLEVEKKLSALFAMGRSQLPRWHKTLLLSLNDPRDELRIEAIRACGETGLVDAVPKLCAIIEHGSVDLAQEAIEALGRIGDESSVDQLTTLLSHPNPTVRKKASEALAAAEEFGESSGLFSASDLDIVTK